MHDGMPSINLDRLQVAQNSLARVVCQASHSASATELRRQLHWLPIRQWIAYELAVITYRRPHMINRQTSLSDEPRQKLLPISHSAIS